MMASLSPASILLSLGLNQGYALILSDTVLYLFIVFARPHGIWNLSPPDQESNLHPCIESRALTTREVPRSCVSDARSHLIFTPQFGDGVTLNILSFLDEDPGAQRSK